MRADSNTPVSGTDVCIRQVSCAAWERNASQTRLWPEVWEFKTVYFITASSTRDRKTLLFPETFSQIWWRGSDYPTLGHVPLIGPTAVPRGMCCSERPGLGYVYLWGTGAWGWERYPYLNHPGRKAGFPEGREQNRQETHASSMDLIALYHDCVSCVSFRPHIRLRTTAQQRRSHLWLSQCQQEMAKPGSQSLKKGRKENPQAPRPCAHVAFALSTIAS